MSFAHQVCSTFCALAQRRPTMRVGSPRRKSHVMAFLHVGLAPMSSGRTPHSGPDARDFLGSSTFFDEHPRRVQGWMRRVITTPPFASRGARCQRESSSPCALHMPNYYLAWHFASKLPVQFGNADQSVLTLGHRHCNGSGASFGVARQNCCVGGSNRPRCKFRSWRKERRMERARKCRNGLLRLSPLRPHRMRKPIPTVDLPENEHRTPPLRRNFVDTHIKT